MKVVADSKIPFLKGVLEPFADVNYIPGKDIANGDLKNADALLIRTRTVVNENLLENTPVKFVGTATIGYNHIDTAYCERNGITWKNAPGCNAGSVAQYMASVLVSLAERYGFWLKNRVLGVVGVGNVGSKVVKLADLLGMKVYLCDPPRVRKEGICGFISLEGIVRECDIITFHVPLSYEGADQTWHMIDEQLLKRVNPGTIVINTSRGEIADGIALKKALKKRSLAAAVLDVWENEPDIDRELLDLVAIGTPHIAGYSMDGKAKGTAVVVNELGRYFDLGFEDWEPNDIPVPEDPLIGFGDGDYDASVLIRQAIQATYNVWNDDRCLRLAPADFEKQRGDYPVRREFHAYTLEMKDINPELRKIFRRMGFREKLI
jgi:erythronate-4-phosphate dehydrogenase